MRVLPRHLGATTAPGSTRPSKRVSRLGASESSRQRARGWRDTKLSGRSFLAAQIGKSAARTPRRSPTSRRTIYRLVRMDAALLLAARRSGPATASSSASTATTTRRGEAASTRGARGARARRLVVVAVDFGSQSTDVDLVVEPADIVALVRWYASPCADRGAPSWLLSWISKKRVSSAILSTIEHEET